MSKSPKISVLMAVYNGEKYLRQAIASILGQSYENFEFIIVDDGSIDSTAQILDDFQKTDGRINVHRNQKNRGIVFSLNAGLKIAKGEYIARMDADDISLPDRFEIQSNFLDGHPEVGLVGSDCAVINGKGRIIDYWFQPHTDIAIRWQMLFQNAFVHSSTMYRTLIRKEQVYASRYLWTEDYDFWLRLLTTHKGANIPDILVYYRKHGQNISIVQREHQQQFATEISSRAINEFMGFEFVHQAETKQMRTWFTEFITPIEMRMDNPIVRKWNQLFEVFCDQYQLTDQEKHQFRSHYFQNNLSIWKNLKLFSKLLFRDPQTFFSKAKNSFQRLIRRRCLKA